MRIHRALALALALAAPAPALAQRIPIPLPRFGQQPRATPFEYAIARGDAALGRGELDAARAHFEQARTLDANDARPHFYLGEVELRQGHFAQAEPLFRAALARNARLAEAHAELGAALLALGRAADAQSSAQAALALDSTLGEAHATLAGAAEALGQPERAVPEWRSALRLMPDDASAALGLGLALTAQQPARGSAPRAEAVHALVTAQRLAAGDRPTLLAVAGAYRRLGEAQRALELLEPLRVATPRDGVLLAELGQTLWALERHPEALARLREAVAAEPTRAALHYTFALMAASENDRAGALAALRQVLTLEPAGSPLRVRAEARLQQLGQPGPRR